MRDPALLGSEALVEAVRVLETIQRREAAGIAAAALGLLEVEEVVVEAAEDVAVAAQICGEGVAGFAPHMIAAALMRQGCTTL